MSNYTREGRKPSFNVFCHTVNNIMPPAKVFAVLSVTLTFSACVFVDHNPYPEWWGNPPAAGEGTCTDIAGTFEESLDTVFWSESEREEWEKRLLDVTHVTIEQVTDELIVSAWADATVVARMEIKKDKKNGFVCTAEGLSVKRFRAGGYGGISSWETFTLFKSREGTLIVREEKLGIGALGGVIPMYGNMTEWNRYFPYTDAAKTE